MPSWSAASVETTQLSSGSKDRLPQRRRLRREGGIGRGHYRTCDLPCQHRDALAARELGRQRRKGGLKPGVTEQLVIQSKRRHFEDTFWAARSVVQSQPAPVRHRLRSPVAGARNVPVIPRVRRTRLHYPRTQSITNNAPMSRASRIA